MGTAYLADEPGGPDVLRRVELPDDVLGPTQVRVRHTAIGVNFIDTYFRSGLYAWPGSQLVPGSEAAGVVVEVGRDVTDFAPGDRVVYTTPLGAYRTGRVVESDRLVPLPQNLDDTVAAAIFLKGLTAHYLVTDSHPVRRGENILVHAAAGGVGLLLGQWLAHLGANAIGTAGGPAKTALAAGYGYAHVIDYTQDDVLADVRRLTGEKLCAAAYDSVGRDTWRISLDCLAVRGSFVSFGQSSGPVEGFQLADLARGSFSASRPKLFDFIASPAELRARAAVLFDLVAKGVLKTQEITVRPLADVVAVHTDLEARRTVGSTVLVP
ncbi:quinone oxidoreductase family protein [Acetobacter sp.]|uniref:quinone oxidoreductase family protein n=1 Tax=Acetobacter sp. TaxID=440 RepID=UPI0039E8FDB2